MDGPRVVALSSTKRHTKRRGPFVNSKTPSSMAGPFLSVKIVSRVAAAVVVLVIIFMVNIELVEGGPFRAIIAVEVVFIAVADINNNSSSTVRDSCPVRPPRKGVKSTWAISPGTLDGES